MAADLDVPARHGIRQVPVVLREDPRRMTGILAMRDLYLTGTSSLSVLRVPSTQASSNNS